MVRIPAFLATVISGLLIASSANADPFSSDPTVDETPTANKPASASPTTTPRRPRDAWYGYQTLAIDLPAASLTAIGAFSQHAAGGAIAVAGLSTYALGGPIVHWAHGHVGRGFGSLAMRIAIPLAAATTGMVIGFAAHEDPEPATRNGDLSSAFGWVDEYRAGLYGLIIGGVVGTAGASVIDSLALAREHSAPTTQPKDDAARTPVQARNAKPTWQPTLAPTRGGGLQAGVGGTF